MDPSTETMDTLPDPTESSSIPPETHQEFPGKMDELILDKPGESLAEQAQEPPSSTLNRTDQTKCTSCPLEFNSEIALFEHQILYHNKTEFECKICQFRSSDAPQFRLHLAAHYVTSAVKVKSSLNNAEIPVFSQLETSQDDSNSNNNPSLAPDDDVILLASSDQIAAPKNRKGRRPSGKLPRHPITIDGRYMCKTPGCDFSTKYEFNLTRHEVRHKKRKGGGGGTRPKSTKTWQNSNQRKKIKAKENNSYSLIKPLEEPLGILKSVLLSPTKSLETAGAAEEPTETKDPSESPKSVISSWIEDRKNGQNNGRKNDDDGDDGNKYLKDPSGKYKCKKCYYTTSFKCNMIKHFPTHSNDLPYKCHYCDYRSRWEQNVKAHEKSQHFGIRRKSKTSTTKKPTKITKKVKAVNREPNEMAKKIVKTEPNDMIKVTKNADSEIVAKVGPPKLNTSEPAEGKDMEQDKSKRRLSSEILEEADGNFYCKECNYMSKDKRLLISHLKRHSDERPFPCNFPGCAYRTKWSHWARAHERNVHGFNRFENVKSKKAGKWKPTTFAGTMESRRFQLGIQIGEIVQGSSSSPLTIKLEEPFTKKLEGPFTKKLEGPFTKKLEGPFTKKLVRKDPKIKTNEKLVQSALAMVAGTKASEKINCPECGMKCLPRFLQRHLMVHSDEKPYVCAAQGCDYRTRWPGDLKVHMKRHGPAVNKRAKNLLKKSSFRRSAKTTVLKTSGAVNAKRFKCPDCEYHGATGWHVNRHRLTHGNVPPLSCPEVGCSFTTRDRRYLVKHQIEFHDEGQGRGQGLLTTRRVPGQWDAEDKDCRFCEYLKKVAFYVRRYVKGCPGCKKPTALLDQPKVDHKSGEIEEEKKNNNEKEEAGMDLGLADSSGFACMLCDFVGDSEGAALEHAKCHPQPSIKINKLEMIAGV